MAVAKVPEVLSIGDMMKLKVPELREELKKRGLSVSGLKGVLQSRLKSAMEENDKVSGTDEETESEISDPPPPEISNKAGAGFDDRAHWVLLEQDGDEILEEQRNLRDIDGQAFRAPTEPENEVKEHYAKKKNYSYQIDRPVFTGKATLPRKWTNGQLAVNSEGVIQYDKEQPVDETTPNIEWCR
jgi:hypothetical protein